MRYVLAKETLTAWYSGLAAIVLLVSLSRCSASQERVGVTELVTPEVRRALVVNACLTDLVLSVPPDAGLHTDPREITDEELELVARLVEGVAACRESAK